MEKCGLHWFMEIFSQFTSLWFFSTWQTFEFMYSCSWPIIQYAWKVANISRRNFDRERILWNTLALNCGYLLYIFSVWKRIMHEISNYWENVRNFPPEKWYSSSFSFCSNNNLLRFGQLCPQTFIFQHNKHRFWLLLITLNLLDVTVPCPRKCGGCGKWGSTSVKREPDTCSVKCS